MVITGHLHLTQPLRTADRASRALRVLLAGRELVAVGIWTAEGALLAVSVIGARHARLAGVCVPATLVPCSLAIMEALRHLQTGA